MSKVHVSTFTFNMAGLLAMGSVGVCTVLLFGCSKSQPRARAAFAHAQIPALESSPGPEQSPNSNECPNRHLCTADATWSNCQATNFAEEEIHDNQKWKISTWGSENRAHSADNLTVREGMLHLLVTGGTARGETTMGAEISSARNDYLYGSFRLVARGTDESGTVLGWFYYLNGRNEIDIEILSQFDQERKAHFTIHENIGPQTHQIVDSAFVPSAGFHEYRFDWFSSRVDFYIDDKKLTTFTKNVPQAPGRILLNHWTSSSDGWGGGPPIRDATVSVCSIEIYTNH